MEYNSSKSGRWMSKCTYLVGSECPCRAPKFPMCVPQRLLLGRLHTRKSPRYTASHTLVWLVLANAAAGSSNRASKMRVIINGDLVHVQLGSNNQKERCRSWSKSQCSSCC